ncbi:hypothetical protein WICMUC_005173 [Wickerhamomyces mucosus]|uniref:Pseudouridine synthase RsuA/RluA-like domain-containing protein n=1 Tax=Wickerhamomyces mucosus TaxID=1378264 RepID=A0A9P8T783_9ASCO|nr:hypothetical protein WICMUC_005173 [Wickerhamomyces mucosus]
MKTSVEHFVHNGLRKIKPYYHTSTTFVKGRWLNRSILDVLIEEFKSRNKDFYLKEIINERIIVIRNNLEIKGSQLENLKLQNKDQLKLIIHKHEPSILNFNFKNNYDNDNDKIPIIFENKDLLVVNKPSSIPIHPTGKYFNNTLVEIIKSQDIDGRYNKISPCHRLDRLTSGIVILAKNSKYSSFIQKLIQSKNIDNDKDFVSNSTSKYYIARISGKFPQFSSNFNNGTIVCNEPIGNIDVKLGFNSAILNKNSSIKPAITEFQLLKYNSKLNESIVMCKPLTGRTHQIRIHLKYLGFPIVNDPLYGPNSSKIRYELMMMIKDPKIANDSQIVKDLFKSLELENRLNLEKKNSNSKCKICEEIEFNDPNLKDLLIYLHAQKYEIKINNNEFLKFETEMPEWSNI